MSKEPINIDTSKNAEVNKEPGLPIKIPLSLLRWLLYSVAFMLLLLPFISGQHNDGPKVVCGGLILGWFAGLLNAIANKK